MGGRVRISFLCSRSAHAGRGKTKAVGLVLARRARVVKLIVTLWAVLVEARSKRPISLVAERISSKLGRTI
jgi:hypothetical protein